MKKAFAVIVGLLLLVLLVLFSSTYTVRFHEVAIKKTFGKTGPDSIQDEAGVHFRFPLFVDRVTKYDKRLQLSETPLEEVATADGQSVVVRAFLMWKIDPKRVLTFAGSYPDKMSDADDAITLKLRDAVKGSVGQYAFDDLIGAESRLPQVEDDIKGQLASLNADMGVEPVTVGISRIKLPAKTTTAVLARMQATRHKLTETERTRGNSDAVGIRSEANTIADKLRAFAGQRVEQIRGMAEQDAAKYLQAMSEDERLAIFLVRLKTLRASLGSGTTLILSDEAYPWLFLNLGNMTGPVHIPQPRKDSQASTSKKRAATDDDETASPAPGS